MNALDELLDIAKIQTCISAIPFVNEIYFFKYENHSIKGKIEISFEGLESLDFEVSIKPPYPFRWYDSESISFINKELIEYNHVMGDGNICIHTSHSSNIEEKLQIDFNSLKNWIDKYYIKSISDENYEHIIVDETTIDDKYYSYIFAETDKAFKKNEFGTVYLSQLKNSIYKEKENLNYLVLSFESHLNTVKQCRWSNVYSNLNVTNEGLYIFIETIPALYNKFIYADWLDFQSLFTNDFLQELNKIKKIVNNKDNLRIPLFIGYRTVKSDIHWNVALLEACKFPIEGIPIELGGKKTGHWTGNLISQKIDWALSENGSYSYFFGRGSFSHLITEKKILIIGIGAVGSIIAKTLVRSGCKYLDITDIDTKKPENVCRSEYEFSYGICNKTEELLNIITSISPHCNIRIMDKEYFGMMSKVFHQNKEAKKVFSNNLNEYDLIFDCTTDNDLMYILNTLELTCNLINISITNHAKELVCAFHPNIYRFVMNQFKNVLNNDVNDLYNPTGCWSPTFKASYNDIDLLVQMALKNINEVFSNKKAINNFTISFEGDNTHNLIIKEF